jgi:hypothetical protein
MWRSTATSLATIQVKTTAEEPSGAKLVARERDDGVRSVDILCSYLPESKAERAGLNIYRGRAKGFSS